MQVIAYYREVILKEAKTLVEHTKKLVSSATRGQEELAASVQESSSSIASLVDAIKLGAVSLGSEDPDTQVSRHLFIVFTIRISTALHRLFFLMRYATSLPRCLILSTRRRMRQENQRTTHPCSNLNHQQR